MKKKFFIQITFISLFHLTVFAQTEKVINKVDSKGNKTGVWIEYYENGVIKNVNTYKQGKLNGTCYSYDTLGNTQTVIDFVDDKHNGRSRHYHPNGKLFLDIPSNMGKPTYYVQYTPEGKVEMIIEYDSLGNSTRNILYDQRNGREIISAPKKPIEAK